MITLKNDSLSFSFPEIEEALRHLVEHHINTTLPAMLAAGRAQCCGQTLQSSLGFREASPQQRRKAESQVIEASAKEIEAALRRACMSVLGNGAWWSFAGPTEKTSITALHIEFQRTLRIPDDGKIYPLPAGFGRFPLRHVDDYNETIPAPWFDHGGVLMPMFQNEALWINFHTSYPFAVMVAAGKINAVTGEPWTADLQADPQNYVVLPKQPWLDGFAVTKGRDPSICRDAAWGRIFD